MFRIARLVMAGVAMCTGVVGCASSHVSSEKPAHVVCDKCKVADVRTPYTVPGYEGPREEGFLTTKAPECPSCHEAEASYDATGKFEPACKTCGGRMKVAEAAAK